MQKQFQINLLTSNSNLIIGPQQQSRGSLSGKGSRVLGAWYGGKRLVVRFPPHPLSHHPCFDFSNVPSSLVRSCWCHRTKAEFIDKVYARQGSRCLSWALPGHVPPANLSLPTSSPCAPCAPVSPAPTRVPACSPSSVITFGMKWTHEGMSNCWHWRVLSYLQLETEWTCHSALPTENKFVCTAVQLRQE